MLIHSNSNLCRIRPSPSSSHVYLNMLAGLHLAQRRSTLSCALPILPQTGQRSRQLPTVEFPRATPLNHFGPNGGVFSTWQGETRNAQEGIPRAFVLAKDHAKQAALISSVASVSTQKQCRFRVKHFNSWGEMRFGVECRV